MNTYQEPKPWDPVSSYRNPGNIENVSTYIRKISVA